MTNSKEFTSSDKKAVERSREISHYRSTVESHSPHLITIFDSIASGLFSLLAALLNLVTYTATTRKRAITAEKNAAEALKIAKDVQRQLDEKSIKV